MDDRASRIRNCLVSSFSREEVLLLLAGIVSKVFVITRMFLCLHALYMPREQHTVTISVPARKTSTRGDTLLETPSLPTMAEFELRRAALTGPTITLFNACFLDTKHSNPTQIRTLS